jgi:hypothetical protein
MAIISIGDNHKPHLARLQHIAEHLQAERARLEAELRYVLNAGNRAQAELLSFIQQVYGVDAQHAGIQIDADAGIITTRDIEPPTPSPTAAHEAE